MTRAAHLIARLLEDPGFRAAYRGDAAAACRALGMALPADRDAPPLQVLGVRESRSGLGGIALATAIDGVAAAQEPDPVEPARQTGGWRATGAEATPAAADDGDYPGDAAPKERIARWMAHHAARHDLPPELPVMAALVESELENVPHGDRTSVGYFQMQTAVWLDDYPGYPEDPRIQLRWFIDQALAVRARRPALAEDSSLWGAWVADIERPLESLRWKYADRLDDARALLRDGPGRAATAPLEPGPQAAVHTGAQDAVRPEGRRDRRVEALKAEAERIDDAQVPYLWGGGHAAAQPHGSPVTPLDCSGAVSRVLGIDPLVSGQLESWGAPGPGRRVTIYSNERHVLMEIDGRFWGTSASNPGGGPGWIPRRLISASYLAGFTMRHPPGL
jgi:hypothetical protein